jgi:hypothetical protein
VYDSKGSSTISRSCCLNPPACSPSSVAEGALEVVFFALRKEPLDLVCKVLGSSNSSRRLIETHDGVRFRTVINDGIFCRLQSSQQLELFPLQADGLIWGSHVETLESCSN